MFSIFVTFLDQIILSPVVFRLHIFKTIIKMLPLIRWFTGEFIPVFVVFITFIDYEEKLLYWFIDLAHIFVSIGLSDT